MLEPADSVFRGEFPTEFFRRALRGLLDAHRVAREESLSYESPEAVNLEPALRRAKVQTMANEVASSCGLTATATHGEGSSSWWFHRRVQSGRAILTFHSAGHPDEVLPRSEYRDQYIATSNRQLSLFEDGDPQDALRPDDWIVYGMLLHGRGEGGTRGELGFAVIRFPLPPSIGYGYYESKIDLLGEFPAIAAEMRGNQTDQIDRQVDQDIDFRDDQETA